jgi:hypothetical protein
LPEGAAAALALRKRSPLLEPTEEIEQAALVGNSLAQQMQVIGHEAISMDDKPLKR